jgi:purine-binding chemotaxis protein CheW
VIEFTSAGERYAFETAHVAQVYPVGPITVIPGVPDFVVGIIAAQGNVLPVIDLRMFLNLPLSSLAEPAAIVVLAGEDMETGILAEEILGIRRYSADSLEYELTVPDSVRSTYLLGVTLGRTAILDASRLLSDPRLVVDMS